MPANPATPSPTGVYGKLPGHGDFVRRGLPQSFLGPWDACLQGGVAAAMATLGHAFASVWTAAPAWRFHLPAGVSGPGAVAGVLLASADAVGREYPLTLAALVSGGRPAEGWFDTLERAGRAACDQRHSVDQLLARLPEARAVTATVGPGTVPGSGWWTSDGSHWPLGALPSPQQFVALLRGPQAHPSFTARAATHRGTVRSRNEDAFVERGDIGLWAVADGAGGHGAGDVASAAVAQALASLPPGLSAAEVLAQVRLRLAAVHQDLQQLAASNPQGPMPATTVVVLLARDDHFACLWAGDSRAYLLRDGKLCQLTEDHSLLQELLKASLVTPEEAENHPQANVITRAVGGHDKLVLDKVAGRLSPGDQLLLCTDGLFKALAEPTIAQVMREGGSADELLQRSLQAGARDNVTALIVSI